MAGCDWCIGPFARPPSHRHFAAVAGAGYAGRVSSPVPLQPPNYLPVWLYEYITLQLQICEPNGEKEGNSKTITIHDELSLWWLPMGRATISGVMCETRSPGSYHPSIGKVRYSTYMQQRPAECLGNESL
jgi:hypothetical protein